jgi:hypothetical protein
MSSEEDAAASVVVSFLPTGDAAQREAVHRVRGGRLDGGWQGLRIGYCRSSAAQHPRATRSMSSAGSRRTVDLKVRRNAPQNETWSAASWRPCPDEGRRDDGRADRCCVVACVIGSGIHAYFAGVRFTGRFVWRQLSHALVHGNLSRSAARAATRRRKSGRTDMGRVYTRVTSRWRRRRRQQQKQQQCPTLPPPRSSSSSSSAPRRV